MLKFARLVQLMFLLSCYAVASTPESTINNRPIDRQSNGLLVCEIIEKPSTDKSSTDKYYISAIDPDQAWAKTNDLEKTFSNFANGKNSKSFWTSIPSNEIILKLRADSKKTFDYLSASKNTSLGRFQLFLTTDSEIIASIGFSRLDATHVDESEIVNCFGTKRDRDSSTTYNSYFFAIIVRPDYRKQGYYTSSQETIIHFAEKYITPEYSIALNIDPLIYPSMKFAHAYGFLSDGKYNNMNYYLSIEKDRNTTQSAVTSYIMSLHKNKQFNFALRVLPKPLIRMWIMHRLKSKFKNKDEFKESLETAKN